MTAEEFGELCRECCTKKSVAECLFADGEVGFIDTSVNGDGSRGIAFSKRKMMVNFDGTVKNVAYCKIRSVQIISSQEDAFADELEIFGGHSRLRISDCSLDKSKLKRIIEALQEGLEEKIDEASVEETLDEKVAEEENREKAPAEKETLTEEAAEEETREDIPAEKETLAEEVKPEEIPAEKKVTAEEEKPEEASIAVPEEKDAEEKPSVFEEKIMWLSDIKGAPAAEKEAEFETADSGFIEQMSREEMLDFLSGAMKEINYDEPASQEELPEIIVKQPEFVVQTNAREEARAAENKREAVLAEALAVEEKKAPEPELSKEPAWGDIYIKASRSLRELCESGRLSMERIEEELREKLLDSARAFAEIISDEQKVPKVLLPKITELKNASNNFDEYFSYGEDIGIRVMFFMLYQMLSYADRIAENPDTKERLNDFFRRFGVAGITLSMLDVRA